MRKYAVRCGGAKITFRVRCIQPGSATSPMTGKRNRQPFSSAILLSAIVNSASTPLRLTLQDGEALLIRSRRPVLADLLNRAFNDS